MEGSNTRALWQGLRTITDYKATHPRMMRADTSLADDLNNFFESDSRQEAALPAGEEETLTVMELEVRRLFRGVNTRKAAGPDGISGQYCTVLHLYFNTLHSTLFY